MAEILRTQLFVSHVKHFLEGVFTEVGPIAIMPLFASADDRGSAEQILKLISDCARAIQILGASFGRDVWRLVGIHTFFTNRTQVQRERVAHLLVLDCRVARGEHFPDVRLVFRRRQGKLLVAGNEWLVFELIQKHLRAGLKLSLVGRISEGLSVDYVIAEVKPLELVPVGLAEVWL